MKGEGIKKVVEWVYKRFETGSGAMILMTSITGMALSTIAQTGAIIFNKKYNDSQKAFMIPQELTEGLINICSMFLITKPLQRLSGKLVMTGKIATKEVLNYMKNNNLLEKRGSKGFDIGNHIKEAVSKLESSEIIGKLSEAEKTRSLAEYRNIIDNYDIYSDSVSAIATTAGAVFSTALIAPLIRNSVASRYQKINMSRINDRQVYMLGNDLKI